ncbi:MAG TPA: PQQ-binding-like beta-propeller repeat protein, partial [Pirellulaceae bacterium]|nr:PQQ-binding-like beta-propeller repeat protein [Pirellulaceae bacterium]
VLFFFRRFRPFGGRCIAWASENRSLSLLAALGLLVAAASLSSFRHAPAKRPTEASVSRNSPPSNEHASDFHLREPAVVWRAGRPDEAFHSTPTIAGRYIYCVGSDSNSARVVAIDALDGRIAWSGGPGKLRPTFSSPVVVVAGRLLLCGEGLHKTRDARVFALDLRPGREGEPLWTIPTNGHVECTPAVSGDRFYFGAGDDGLFGYQLAAEPTSPPRRLFHLTGERYTDVETAVTVDGERLYVGLGEGGNAVCLLDAATGRELARATTPAPVFSPPVVHGELVLIGCGAADYARPGAAKSGHVIGFDAESLVERWRVDVGGTVLGQIAVRDDCAYFGCGDGAAYRLDLRTRQTTIWTSGGPIAAALTVIGEDVVGINHQGRLFALDRATWQPRWQLRVGAPGPYVSSPLAAGGRIVLGTPNEGVVGVGQP